MKYKNIKAVIASMLLFVGFTANAGIIVDNGFNVNASNGQNWTNSIFSWRTWDDFTLTSNTTITSASFLMATTSSSYVFDIRNDNNGSFGSSVFSMALSSVSVSPVALGFYRFDFNLPSLTLAAGTYWVSFSGDSLYGSKIGSFANTMLQEIGGVSYRRDNNYIPFQLNGTTTSVPEPSTFAIFSLGIIVLASRRFKK